MLGLGEAGSRLATDLVAANVEAHAYDPAITSTPDGVVRAPDPVPAVAGRRVILCVTTASTALAAAE